MSDQPAQQFRAFLVAFRPFLRLLGRLRDTFTARLVSHTAEQYGALLLGTVGPIEGPLPLGCLNCTGVSSVNACSVWQR